MEGVIPDYEVSLKSGILHAYPEPNYILTKGLGYFIFERCDQFSNDIFQICPYTNQSLTFGEFKVKSVNLAINLQKSCSIQEGDIIMTCMKNSLENAVPIAATFFLNAITCSLDPSLSVRDCEHLIGLAEPKVIIVDKDVVENIKAALKNISKEAMLIVNTDSGKIDGNLHLQQLLHSSKNSKKFRPVIVEDGNTMGTILFSSGTTGLPKGICLSHRSIFISSNCIHLYMGCPNIMTFCTTFYWISGLVLFISQFIKGTMKVALTKFDMNFFLDVCEKYKVEATFLGTCYLYKLFDVIERVNALPSMRQMWVGGMMANKGLFANLRKTFPSIEFIQAYGLSESSLSGTGFFGKYLHLSAICPESAGIPIPGVDIKVLDKKTGKILGANEIGIIYLRSTWYMLGYYKYKGENPFQGDGFINTGDMGYYDENKLIYISGRSKDMFKYQSWHIVPASIEAVIKEHPAVDEAVVFGIPHGEDGHLPSAAITLKQNRSKNVEPEEIDNFVAERVADRQRLRGGIYILTELPRTATGKIQSSKICDMFTNSKKF